jgi:hypothetical protein
MNRRRRILVPLAIACVAAIAVVRNRARLHPYLPYQWHSRFAIAVYAGPTPLSLSPQSQDHAPSLRPEDVTDIRAEFVADPFLMRTDDRWWLFFEALNVATNQGDIAVASSADAHSWHYEKVVLDEPFHLSYPYVFEDHGSTYMLPESAEAGALRLYRAKKFPFEWELYATLLKGVYLDSSIIFYAGRWWIFTCPSVDNDEMSVFFADDLKGPWHAHPSNPIIRKNPYKSRPGGRLLEYAGHLLRFAQVDQPNYGQGIRAFEVTRLTPDAYEEREASPTPIIQASGSGWNASGMHQVDAHQVGDTWIAAVDGYYFQRTFGLPTRFLRKD